MLSKVLFFILVCFIASCVTNKPRPTADCQRLEGVLVILIEEMPKRYRIQKIIVSDKKCTKSGLEFTLEIIGKSKGENILLRTKKRLLLFERDNNGLPDLLELKDFGVQKIPNLA